MHLHQYGDTLAPERKTTSLGAGKVQEVLISEWDVAGGVAPPQRRRSRWPRATSTRSARWCWHGDELPGTHGSSMPIVQTDLGGRADHRAEDWGV